MSPNLLWWILYYGKDKEKERETRVSRTKGEE